MVDCVELLLRFALTARSSSQLTGINHSFAALSPLVSVLGIIDAQGFLFNIIFHHLISCDFFRPTSICLGTLSFLTHLTKFA